MNQDFFPAEQNKKILTEDRVKQIMDHTPLRRFGKPKELMLSSCKFVNGSEIVVDGGFNAMKI